MYCVIIKYFCKYHCLNLDLQQTAALCAISNTNNACGTALTDVCSYVQIPNTNAAAMDIYCGMFLNVGPDNGANSATYDQVLTCE